MIETFILKRFDQLISCYPTDPSNDSSGNQRKGIGFAEIFDLTNYYRLTVYISKYYHRERSQYRSQNSR